MPRHRKNRSRKMKGGSGNYTDGASYGMYVNGTSGSQWSRTMDQGGAYGQVPGNVIIGAQGQNVVPHSQMPSQSNLQLVQNGGANPYLMNQATPGTMANNMDRRPVMAQQRAGRRHRRGGFLGEVINQAAVPLSILAMQQTYRRKRGGRGCKSRKTRRHRRRR
jgi:hypothetical protein